MSKEFGTVNVRRGDRAREIEILRQQYARHRESLASLAADAPTEHLAAEYHRLIREIDTAIGKLGELEGRVPSDTQPGTRPLLTPPGMITPDVSEPVEPGSSIPRVALIIAAGVIVLVLIGWLMWRASGERPATPVVRERVETGPITPAPKPVPVAVVLTMQPHVHDYGTIRKGTRAVRQFEVMNNGDEPVVVEVARSACRCLYYANANPVAPHKKETITVTVDGAKAKLGTLHETIVVSSKKDPSVSTSFDVNATIK
jgi:hypothetical protein